ncbi:hypothetical protein ACFY5F_30325 [Streptomyces sp. NPDC013161]|uniref:hypothetical protein n=1 Tax=Streptomyces sp. NPDC013161 TaxID=3364862 RepID=UPI0036CEB42D
MLAEKLASNAVTLGKLASGAVIADALAADDITGREIAANSVNANEIAAASISTDKLVVTGGTNVLSDPSFEGAYTAAIATTVWSVTSGGNGSAKALRVDATATAATTRSLNLTSMPILSREQLYLAIDAILADHALREAQLTARLADGHRYNKATTLVTEADEDPELIILRTLEDDLLPAFDYKPRYVGHRPWKDLFDKALSQVIDEAQPATGTSLRDCGPGAHTTPPDVGEDAEPTTDMEPDPVADNDPAIEPDPTPAPDGDQQADNPAVDEAQEEGPSPVEEPDPEAAQQPPSSDPETNSASESRPSDQSDNQPDARLAAETSLRTKRRPRNRTSKRRPKTGLI